MIIYHGHPSTASLEACRAAAPSHDHRAMFSEFLTDREGVRYAIDNGAFSSWKNGEGWIESGRAKKFVRMLERSKTKPRLPDFVIIPDVVMNPDATFKRSKRWVSILRDHVDIDTDFYFSCQNGMDADSILSFSDRIGADGVFVGGDKTFKRSILPELTDHGLPVHVGRPGDLGWAKNNGADSVDTTTIVHDQDWDKLKQLETQTTVTAF